MTHSEICGENTLYDIYRDPGSYGVDVVVRWCWSCGAVVVDGEVDGRTLPGDVMKMKFPLSAKTFWDGTAT